VEYGADFVSVIADCNGSQREFRAQYVVVTLPLGVLQLPVDHPAHVEFEPVLKSKSRAFACLAMGNVLRINLLFSEQFWSRRWAC
jgi:monoamine oxidase